MPSGQASSPRTDRASGSRADGASGSRTDPTVDPAAGAGRAVAADRAASTELAGAIGATAEEALERARRISREARERALAWERADRLRGSAASARSEPADKPGERQIV